MLSPEEIAAVAERIVDGYEQKLVGSIFDQLVAALGRDGVLSITDLRTLETAAGINRDEVMRLVASHAPRIAAEVRSEVTRILRTADTADMETLSKAYAVGSAGASAAFARIAQETTEGLVQIIARENIRMAQRAQDVWYDVTAEAITSWNHGGMTADKIMGRAVTRLSREGFVTIDYRSGVKTSIDAAVRRHIVSQVAQASTRMTDARLAEYGHDLVMTSAHFGARPSHGPWQGRVFSRSGRTPGYPDFVFATGYGTVAGLAGANCRHTFGPYFPGITELQQMPERVNGLTSDEMYEATQKQRGFERAIRDTKREIAALEATGADATGKRLLLGRQQARLRGYLDKTGLTRQRVREKAYAIGAQPRALGRR